MVVACVEGSEALLVLDGLVLLGGDGVLEELLPNVVVVCVSLEGCSVFVAEAVVVVMLSSSFIDTIFISHSRTS